MLGCIATQNTSLDCGSISLDSRKKKEQQVECENEDNGSFDVIVADLVSDGGVDGGSRKSFS
jgi:hypothetical protein